MIPLNYFISRALKKLRGSAIADSRIHSTSKIESGSAVVGTNVSRHSFCGYDCLLLHCDVGAFTSIASKVTAGGVRHPIEFVSTSPVFLSHRDSIPAKFAMHEYKPIHRTFIGNDVWVGDGAYIKAGIRIGDGAVVGMGAVVTKDVEPYSIVGGNPAKLIRMRFPPEIINGLLLIKWWEFDDAKLKRLGHLFNDPQALLKSEGFL